MDAVKKITYVEAISQAIREEMLRDDAVFLLAEDMAAASDAFHVGAGLLEEFGAVRVVDTPMSEAVMIGSAVGAALMGLRPIAEMRYINAVSCGFSQIVQMASRMYWRVGMPIPVVVRGPSGRRSVRTGHTEECEESGLFHASGLKVVVPSTAYDAKGMLKAAIRDDDPVLYLEHQWLYRLPELSEEVPMEDYVVPLGKAIIRREGEDMTILTYGAMVHQCLKVAQVLAQTDDLEVEVLDLRSLSPLDHSAIMESVKRTNKVLIVHEDNLAGGIGAELSSILADDLGEFLDGPISRVSAPEMPFPYAPPLEDAYVPHAGKILAAARALAAY